jgi:CDP-diacylglycerol---glycerol-3-phosphate 3-phosphatidyltransferase
MNLNLPNKITLSRILIIPLFVVILLCPFSFGYVDILNTYIPVTHLLAALIFIIASVTDGIDGYYARKLNLITNLGKFLDPLADKLLVTAAFVALVGLKMAPAWIVIVILSREFAVTGLRLVAVNGGEVIAASNFAKWKTRLQIIAISSILLHNFPFQFINFPFDIITLWIAMILTILSGWDYFVKNKTFLIGS